MRPENPLDSMPLVHLLDQNLIIIALGIIVFLAVLTRIFGWVNGPSGSGGGPGSDDWFGDGGGGDGGGGGGE